MFRPISLVFLLATLLSLFASKTYGADSSSLEDEKKLPLKIVTSFSILENLVQDIGGDHVEILNLVGRNADAHIYQPTPSDAVAISNAELVIMNGLGFEGWITRLMDNNGYQNSRLVASDGVNVFQHDDEVDPHAWQSFENIRIYIDNITRALLTLKPEHGGDFLSRQEALINKINNLEAEAAAQMNSIPVEQRLVVTSHDAFAYLGREFDIKFIAPLGFNSDVEPSAADVAAVIDQINELGVKALFVENISSPRLLEQISSETSAQIGGSLYSDALSELEGSAGTYLDMMRYNIETLANALSSE